MLTTRDNPYNPLEDYNKWMLWDADNQYFTSEYIARISEVSPDMDDAELEQRIDEAIQEILKYDTLEIYTLV